MPERFVLDVWYVDHWSLLLDLQIIARTMRIVVTGRGTELDATPAPVLVDGHFPSATVPTGGGSASPSSPDKAGSGTGERREVTK
jgi:hypothetical protein